MNQYAMIWLILASVCKIFALKQGFFMGFYLSLGAFCALTFSFSHAHVPEVQRNSESKLVNTLMLGVLFFMLAFVYFDFIFSIILRIPYYVSWARFIFFCVVTLFYSFFGVALIAFMVHTMWLCSYQKLRLSLLLHEGARRWRAHKLQSASYLLPIGALLFLPLPFYASFIRYSANPYLLFIIVTGLFFFAYIGAVYYLKRYEYTVKSDSMDEVKESNFFVITRIMSLLLLIASPLITVVLFFSGIVAHSSQLYGLMMVCWIIWLLSSVYFLFIRKTQDPVVIGSLYIPLIMALIFLFLM
jgi:MFS family permease